MPDGDAKQARAGGRSSAHWVVLALVRRAFEWTLVLFVLNLGWEFAQLPLYSLGPYEGWPRSAYAVLHCTVGDAGIAFASYIVATALTAHPEWPLRWPLAGITIAIAASLAYTVWAEWRNVYVQGNWAYADAMPTIGGIGLAPLIQWIVLPVLALLWMRRPGGRSSAGRR